MPDLLLFLLLTRTTIQSIGDGIDRANRAVGFLVANTVDVVNVVTQVTIVVYAHLTEKKQMLKQYHRHERTIQDELTITRLQPIINKLELNHLHLLIVVRSRLRW